MTAEQDDLSLAAVVIGHCDHNGYCVACATDEPVDWPCLPYRLAQALSQAQSELERIASHTRDAYDQRDAAQEALAASEAKVARVESLFDGGPDTVCRTVWHDDGWGGKVECVELPMEDLRVAFADPTPTAPCPRETPFKSYTEPTCSLPEGHAGGCLFNSHDGRTPLEVMPK